MKSLRVPCMLLSSLILLILLLQCKLVQANSEKVVFLAPRAQAFPADASIDNLLLTSLCEEENSSVETFVNASFPTALEPKGSQTWFLLENLLPGRKYEVRVNWLATEPTKFWLYTHTMDSAFAEPELISGLTTYSMARHQAITTEELDRVRARARTRRKQRQTEAEAEAEVEAEATTFLFLQILAKADYHSVNRTMMETVPPVHVDIILDPYLLNLLPASLLPTVGFTIVVAVGGWLLSGWIIKSLVAPLASGAGLASGAECRRRRRRRRRRKQE